MAEIKPFRAFRPAKDKVHLVASRSYVTYNENQLREKLNSNPYSFIHIINPDYNASERAERASNELFSKVRLKFEEFVENGIFEREHKPCFYIYRQTSEKADFFGIICSISTRSYKDGEIKIHEQTITRREELFTHYLDTTGFNAEPVLLAYDSEGKPDFYSEFMQNEPFNDFSTADKIRHRLWIIEDEASIEKLTQEFVQVKSLYIADGHHRSASSSLLSEQRIGTSLSKDHDDPGYFMVYILPSDQLRILEFNRLVKDIGEYTVEGFLKKISSFCDVKEISKSGKPASKGIFHFYLDDRWFEVKKPELMANTIDADWLTQAILHPILGISDLKKDLRISFLPGEEDSNALSSKVKEKGYTLGIELFPLSFNELKNVSDVGLTLPPKSTYIEPKLRSGLCIYEFGPNNE